MLRIYLTPILALVFCLSTISQELPKAILLDEFGLVTCEDLQARTDSFLAELGDHTTDAGYVVLNKDGRKFHSYSRIIQASVYMRRFDPSRIKIYLDSSSTSPGGQFWRRPVGSEPPDHEEITTPAYDLSKPFVFGGADENMICSTFIPYRFADLIKANPGSKGRIVVRGPSWRTRKDFADWYVRMFTEEHNLRPDQLMISYVHRPRIDFTDADFWYIPAKQ